MASKALDLPFEITSKIFLDSLPSHGRIRPATDKPPLLLAQICQQWRSVALSTPELWSSIALDHSSTKATYIGLARLFGDLDPPPRAIINLVDQWFMRAGTHPLSITMNCGEEEDVVAALSVYFPRCRTIELSIPVVDFAGINYISIPLPYLRKLNVHVESRPGFPPFLAFPNAPKLEELRLSTPGVSAVRLRLGAASMAMALTHLEIVYTITIQECLDILQNFPQLLHFSVFHFQLTGSEVSHTGRTPESRIFPLQSLQLRSDTSLLALITLPHLQRLTVRFPGSVNSDRLLAFMSRSRANINYFDIRFLGYRCDRALELCLQAVPNVSVLRIQLERPSDLDNIVSDQQVLDQPTIFPSLRTLHVRDHGRHRPPMPQPVVLLLARCFRALSAQGVRIQVESVSFELPEDLTLDESVEFDADPGNPFPSLVFC
ncbi:hypothetical protein C8J57DRAFT_1492367 [Mycena rebaudengoi]|nr:hypothetical protein C8J57DRAFT_1492367 [Mycena rebaudengoi]